LTLRHLLASRRNDASFRTTIRKAAAHRWLGLAAAMTMVAGLAGCASISEQTARTIFAAPAKFDNKNCEEIEGLIANNRSRQKDLEQLMARADQAPSGGFVNAIAYRPDYVQVRGDLERLAKAREDKQCAVDSKFSSGRAVF
jgi:hypothetical protein